MRRVALLLLLLGVLPALLLAGVTTKIAETTVPASFEEAVAIAEMREHPDGLKALSLYPNTAPRVFGLFGHTEVFERVLVRYGPHDIVPLVTKCLTVGDRYLRLIDIMSKGIGAVMSGNIPRLPEENPEDCAWRMLLAIDAMGHDFLNQYTVKDGAAYLLPASATAAAVSRFATTNLRHVERVLASGGMPTVSEWAFASVDVIGLSFAGKGLSLATKVRATARATRVARLNVATTGAFSFVKTNAPTLLKYGALASVPYVMWRHPQVLTGAGGFIADVMGVPRWLGEMLVWFIPLWIAYTLLLSITLPIRWGWRTGRAICIPLWYVSRIAATRRRA